MTASTAAVLLAAVLLLSGQVGAGRGGPTSAHAGCGKLKADFEVVSSFPKNFSGQYTKKVKLSVTNNGPAMRNWRAELYTFSGFRLGKSKFEKKLARTGRTKIRLKQPMQAGKFTLVVKGKVGGCGELETFGVVSFRDCLSKLPVRIIDKPGGFASDYSGFVSTKVAPKSAWAPIKKLRSEIYSFAGVKFGEAELDRGSRRLVGEQFLHHELTRDLEPGKYSLIISGKAPQPRSCGQKDKITTLRFK